MNPQVFLVQSAFSHGFPMVFPWFSHGKRAPSSAQLGSPVSWDRHGNRSAGSPVAAGFPWGFHRKKTWGFHIQDGAPQL